MYPINTLTERLEQIQSISELQYSEATLLHNNFLTNWTQISCNADIYTYIVSIHDALYTPTSSSPAGAVIFELSTQIIFTGHFCPASLHRKHPGGRLHLCQNQ